MAKVGFFTAVSFGGQPKSCAQSLLEVVDSYFYLGGKKAYIIPGQDSEGAVLTKDSPAFLITALKAISYLTLAIPVVMLTVKAALRSIHNFHVIDIKQKLEEGIDISQVTIEKIERLMSKIQRRQDDEEITWYASGNMRVFSLTTVPNLIFKMEPQLFGVGNLCEKRFANMIKAKEVCLAHQLGLLVIPHAKKFNIFGEVTLIAEEYANINQNESVNEWLYQLSGLNETARQLAIFIIKTGFSDVEWRNIPLIDTAPEFQGNRRVSLIDLEAMDEASTGIFGRCSRGLIRCLHSEAQMDIVLAEARRHGVRSSQYVTPEQVKARRMKELQTDQQLQRFYAKNNILENARKLICVDDLQTLGLNLDEKDSINYNQYILRDAVVDVIAQINDAINRTPENATIKGKRYIFLNIHYGSLQDYDQLGVSAFGIDPTDEEYQQRWLLRIINALVAKEHLFKLDRVNGNGYFIQA